MPNASPSRRVSHPGQVSHSQPMQISLLPGQLHGLALARDTVVGVSAGELVLTRRIHLDADVLVVKTRLRAGAVFVAQDSEWAELTSLCAAKVWVRHAVGRRSCDTL